MERGNQPACYECRQRHLKCGGEMPSCVRCARGGTACVYIPSRRGQGPRKRRAKGMVTTPTTEDSSHGSLSASSGPSPRGVPFSAVGDGQVLGLEVQETSAHPVFKLSEAERMHFINLYYECFHPAHPLLRPRAFTTGTRPYYLDLLICFIGHHYDGSMLETAGLPTAVDAAMSQPDEQTASRMQALVLYSIVLHTHNQPKRAEGCISRARHIALGLGINHPGFDHRNTELDTVGSESLRRTWWELYIIDTYFAALHRRPSATNTDVDAFSFLPCLETLYESGECSIESISLQMFENRMFAPDGLVSFSSYSYRIEATRILARVLSLSISNNTGPDDVEAVDHAIAGWQFNLSDLDAGDPKFSAHDDQMMFQAHLFIQCARILLHFPRSDLSMTVPTSADIGCARGCKALIPTSNQHTTKAILASKDIANLATLPGPLKSHSPLLICGLVLACMVQLAAASAGCQTSGFYSLHHYRDRIVLLLGALKIMGRKWLVARRAAHHLKTVANTVFAIPQIEDHSGSHSVDDSGIDVGEIPSDLAWFDLLSPNALSDALQQFDDQMADQRLFEPLPPVSSEFA